MKQSIIALVLATTAAWAQAETLTVDQKDKAFSKSRVTVKVGDSVAFRNSDSFFHNVFSLSDAKSFDLGSYPQGQSKAVTFEKAGNVDVECAIHPGMKMTVEVKQ